MSSIIFGRFSYKYALMEESKKSITVNVLKVNESLNMVYGYALVSKIDGEDYYDTQGDNIPDDVIVPAAKEFAENSQRAEILHSGVRIGKVLHTFPMTDDIAKSLSIEPKMTGLLIGMHVTDDRAMKMVRAGELRGFSMGGFIAG